MNPIALQVASGSTFFIGIFLLIVVACLGMILKHRYWDAVFRILTILSITSILISSTPLPFWFYVLWGIPGIGLLIMLYFKKDVHTKGVRIVRIAVIVLSLIAIGWELPYHLEPAIHVDHARDFIVIGDSISAGVENDGVTTTWPAIFEKQFEVNVIDLASPGLTLELALHLVKKTDLKKFDNPVVLLEIGGNDMLGGTPVSEFTKNLDELLQRMTQISDTVILLELPLPPFHHLFGKTQRDLAERYQVILVPKRYFTYVFSQSNATIDGLHLSQSGHQDMAETLWELMK